jgi:hypothetical protein
LDLTRLSITRLEVQKGGFAQISIARARISDYQGRLIGEYIYEAETGLRASKGVKGVDIGWFMEGVAATEAPSQTP